MFPYSGVKRERSRGREDCGIHKMFPSLNRMLHGPVNLQFAKLAIGIDEHTIGLLT